jgi:hypothetical protein
MNKLKFLPIELKRHILSFYNKDLLDDYKDDYQYIYILNFNIFVYGTDDEAKHLFVDIFDKNYQQIMYDQDYKYGIHFYNQIFNFTFNKREELCYILDKDSELIQRNINDNLIFKINLNNYLLNQTPGSVFYFKDKKKRLTLNKRQSYLIRKIYDKTINNYIRLE